MTQGPPEYGEQPDENPGHQPQQPPHAQYGQQYGPPPYGQLDPAAPYGRHPVTGEPYSDKSKVVAGILQILVPLGIGRMYIGDTQTGVIQLVVTLVTCGLGALWPIIDGILMLVGDPRDEHGRPLRG